MNYFLDTEFIEDGKTIDLISIGIVREDEFYYYAINGECKWEKANDWVKNNVIKKLEDEPTEFLKTREQIKKDILNFCNFPDQDIHFYGYYADYDWVCLCQLFGTMMDLPKHFPMYCRDLKQMLDEKGNPKIPFKPDNEHNALSDAKWNKKLYEWIKEKDNPTLKFARENNL